MKDQGAFHMRLQFLEHGMNQSGFAGAGLTRNHDKPFAHFDAQHHLGVGLLVRIGKKQKARIRGQLKGALAQVVKSQVQNVTGELQVASDGRRFAYFQFPSNHSIMQSTTPAAYPLGGNSNGLFCTRVLT
ncbi:MAG: hypothetical protein ACRENG_35270, partial [bacterium]